MEWLKPDLSFVTASGDYEDHWFIEADLATEHPPVVVRKAKVYQRYAATGAHQARYGLFPAVTWVVPDKARQRALQAALAADRAIQADAVPGRHERPVRRPCHQWVSGAAGNGRPECHH